MNIYILVVKFAKKLNKFWTSSFILKTILKIVKKEKIKNNFFFKYY